jgi:hypothetical protein
MPNINNWINCDVVVQAGHQNTPDGMTGGESQYGKEIEWTPVVADEAVRILKGAGVDAVKIDASIKSKSTGYRCKLATFVHFDDPDSGETGPSVGYPVGMGNEGAAQQWKTLYKSFWPFPETWHADNYTNDLRGYYGYRYTQTADAEFLIELGDLQSERQALWMKPRLKWLGALLAHYLSKRTGLGNVPLPRTTNLPAKPKAVKRRSPKVVTKPAKGAKKVGVQKSFKTKPGHAYYKNGSSPDFADTTGLSGTETTYDDGTIVIEATETIKALRSKKLGPQKASQTRIKKNGTTRITQTGYTYMTRDLSGATLIDEHPGLGNGADFMQETSTQFGKADDQDGGTGSEYFRVVQTCSDVWGCSVTKTILKRWFGDKYWENAARLTALVEVYHPKTGRYGKVPLVDVGPGETAPSGAKIDLSFAFDEYLGTQGKSRVHFRLA